MSQEIAIAVNDRTHSGAWADWADWAGMTASIGCAIHCAAMPLIIAYLPALGLGWLAGEGFHRYMAIFCFVLAIMAFVPGWRSHRSLLPMAWGAAGLLLLNTAAFGLEGSCCPSCSASASETICADDTCQQCEVVAETPTQEAGVATDFFLPLVTPLGGLLLVVGHIVNHRKRCTCQGTHCCQE